MKTGIQDPSDEMNTFTPYPAEIQTPGTATRFQALSRLATATGSSARPLKMVALSVASVVFAAAGTSPAFSDSLAHGFGTSAESVWLVAWGVALLTSATGVRRSVIRGVNESAVGRASRAREDGQRLQPTPALPTSSFLTNASAPIARG
jgi:hypothetical protein